MIQERHEFAAAVTMLTGANDFSIQNVERGEQSGGESGSSRPRIRPGLGREDSGIDLRYPALSLQSADPWKI